MTADLVFVLDLALYAAGALCLSLLLAPVWLVVLGWWAERRARRG